MLRPGVFAALASHAGVALFECCYQPLFPVAARMLRRDFEGSWEAFEDRAKSVDFDWRQFAALFASYGTACAYTPDPNRPGLGGGMNLVLSWLRRWDRRWERTVPRAVRFDEYGDIDVLQVVEVVNPVPGRGQVLVKVVAAGINPGEAAIRRGLLHAIWPATFPSGEGSDLAGIVAEVGPDVTRFSVGDEVLGFVDTRSSHAEFVVADVEKLVSRPARVPWEVAGSLFVAGTTAYAAVRAVNVVPGDTVVVSGAAGGVGSLAVQLAADRGARVIGLASEGHHGWLTSHGVIPLVYGNGVAERIREAAGDHVEAFIDTFGEGYVEMAIGLGVAPDRVDTIIDRAAAEKYGTKTDGSAAAANAEVLAELAGMIAEGRLEIPIAKTYPLTNVREAFRDLELRHTLGKIVLEP
jgi:NADPH:quinone reductase-like Zn-dependent oxidoreductase